MPKGLTRYQRRNNRSNELRNQSRSWKNAWARSQKHKSRIYRRDLLSGETKQISQLDFNLKLIFETGYMVAEKFAPYATKSRVLTDELERGNCRLWTDKAEYWIEKELLSETGAEAGTQKAMARAA